MAIIKKFPAMILGCSLVIVGFISDVSFETGIMIKNAEARIGRPMSPGSVAGVARRSTRRSIRRTGIYVSTLPLGCAQTVIDGTALYQCGTTYYQNDGGQYYAVNVD